jgi:hypothetical protein
VAAASQEFVPWDAMPLNSVWAPTVGCAVYISALVFIPRWRRDKPPLEFPRLVHRLLLPPLWMCAVCQLPVAVRLQLLAHNIFLAATAMMMFVGVCTAVLGTALKYDLWTIWCDHNVRAAAAAVHTAALP